MKTTINPMQLLKYNAFVNVFLNYYSGFYPSDQYEELAKEVYSINPLDAVQGIFDRYNYCLEISKFDNTTEKIQQLIH